MKEWNRQNEGILPAPLFLENDLFDPMNLDNDTIANHMNNNKIDCTIH